MSRTVIRKYRRFNFLIISNSMAEISIIIPIYNAEKYLDRCINSIISQSFNNFELILVIDGSPDNSIIKCREWALKDNRIIVIEQKNQGAHAARFAGFKVSKSRYITFVDADDYLPENALKILYDEINLGYDVVKGQYKSNKRETSRKDEIINGQSFMEQVFLGDIDPFLWGGIYKKEIFKDESFKICINNDISISEDWITNLYIGKYVKTAKIINKIVYNYEDNPESVMHTYITSPSYGKKISMIVDSLIDKDNQRWTYLSELKAASGLCNLFVVNRPFSHDIYKSYIAFIKKYGKEPLKKYVDKRYMRFTRFEPVYIIYTQLYKFIKSIMRKKKAINIKQ